MLNTCLIEEIIIKRVRYCRLSLTGLNESKRLKTKIDWFPEPTPFRERDCEKYAAKSTIFSLMLRCGLCCYDNERPMTHTNQLMDIMSLDETIKKKYLKTGIYYSFYELSSFIKEKGISEFLAKSRIIGIVIKQRSLYVIYYTGNKLMAYTKANAAKAENVLRSHFEMSNTHLSIINIFIGNSEAVFPAIVSGHKYGENRTGQNNPLHNKGGFDNQLNAKTIPHNLPAYYVSLNKKKIETLLEIFQFDSCPYSNRENDFIKSISKNKNVIAQSSITDKIRFSIKEEDTGIYTPCSYMPLYNIHDIADLRLLPKVNVFTTEEKANAISKALGSHLNNIYLIYPIQSSNSDSTCSYATDFKIGPIQRYDNDGFPIIKEISLKDSEAIQDTAPPQYPVLSRKSKKK